MKVFEKEWSQILITDIENAWSFFSDPSNLENLTPDDMSFNILTDLTGKNMYPGMMIRYMVQPLPFFKTEWLTEITQVKDHAFFVDEQRIGPFSLWHHEHHFKSSGQKVIMTDKLHYALPFGILGRLANSLFVEKRIEAIFKFRKKKIQTLFPE